MSSLPSLPGFRVLGRLGRGGMGEVFRAVRVGPGGFKKSVALKRLAVAHSLDARAVQRFFREARIAAQLDHPNIVEVHDLVAAPAGYFIVMDLLRGCTWLQLIDSLGGPAAPWWVPLAIADEALAALEHAHALSGEDGRSLGLVHRDLTPRNLFVCSTGAVKVLDFGLARLIEGLSGRLTGDGQLAGTLEYLSPEQAHGREVDARSDLYQLGACLYHALAGQSPHGSGSRSEVLARVLAGDPLPIGRRRPDLPGAVRLVVDGALARDPESRFAGAAVMRDAVRAALAAAPDRGQLAAVMAAVPIDDPDIEADLGPSELEPEPHATADLNAGSAIGGGATGGSTARAIGSAATDPARTDAATRGAATSGARRIARSIRWAVAALAVAAAAIGGFWLGRADDQPGPVGAVGPARWDRLSFRRGLIDAARFTGEGPSFAMAAAWADEPLDLFLATPGDPVPRARGLVGAELLAVSSRRELALLVDVRVDGAVRRGVLARAPVDAGAPAREALTDVQWADFGPRGELALVRWVDGAARLEYPPGQVLLEERRGWLGPPRVSPDGERIALARHPSRASDAGWLEVVDRRGAAAKLGPAWESIDGLAWRPDGGEVWFSAGVAGPREIHAVEPGGGPVRLVARAPGNLTLLDVGQDGAALVRRDEIDNQVWAGRRDDPPRDLSWLDGSTVYDISRDGRTLLLGDAAASPEAAVDRAHPRVYVRRTDGAPALAIGEGIPAGLSEDASTALVIAPDRRSLSLVSTGGGQPRPVAIGDLTPIGKAVLFGDGKRVLVAVSRPGQAEEVHEIALDGGARRRVGRPGLALPPFGNPLSSDGKQVAMVEVSTGLLQLVSLDGEVDAGEVRPAPGAQPGESFARFRSRRALYVARVGGTRIDVGRIDLDVRTRELWRTIRPPDPSGVVEITSFALASLFDGYAFTCRRRQSTLYLAQGL
jgi:hypothetical protein